MKPAVTARSLPTHPLLHEKADALTNKNTPLHIKDFAERNVELEHIESAQTTSLSTIPHWWVEANTVGGYPIQ